MALRLTRQLIFWLILPLAALYVVLQATQGSPVVLSRWGVSVPSAAQNALVGKASLVNQVAQPVARPGHEQLATFNGGSALQDHIAEGRVEYYRRPLSGGELAYVVVRLDERVHVQVINADGATPASDETGDTIWADRQKHLATVAEMAAAPYAAQPGMELLGAMAFGFHGAVRTSNEGSVVINGEVLRVNAGRAALCIEPGYRARIDLFSAQQLEQCDQAIGGGPVILWQGQIANPAVGAPDGEYLPFNPLGEDFVQLDWRIKIYNGAYPKTAVCVGALSDDRSFLVLANSSGVTGVDFARALRDMGCHSALGGDDDTSTQAVWRGQPFWGNQPREVPDALGVYVRQ